MRNMIILVFLAVLVVMGIDRFLENNLIEPIPVPLPQPAPTVTTVAQEVASNDDPNRPCDFTHGLTMRVPSSSKENIGEIMKNHQEAESKRARPRFKCVLELNGEKIKDILNSSSIGMKDGRAGVIVKK